MQEKVTVVVLFVLMALAIIAGTGFNPLVMFGVALAAGIFFYPWRIDEDEDR